MGENGLVISVNEDLIEVKLRRNEACSKCKACMAGMNDNEMIIKAKNACEANVGDMVVIELKNENFLKAVGIMYGIPCVFFVIGVFIGQLLISELAGFAIGGISVFAVYFFIRKNEHLFNKEEYTPVAVNLYDPKQ